MAHPEEISRIAAVQKKVRARTAAVRVLLGKGGIGLTGRRVPAQVNEVKDVMVENIEKVGGWKRGPGSLRDGRGQRQPRPPHPWSAQQVLERGEKIELLVDKTEDLRNQVPRALTHRMNRPATASTSLMRARTGSCTWVPNRPPFFPPHAPVQAEQFQRKGRQLRSKMWWQVTLTARTADALAACATSCRS
jgi:hypothetical protein